MNKIIFPLILAVALLVSACVPVATMYVCPDGSSVSSPDLCPEEKPVMEDTEPAMEEKVDDSKPVDEPEEEMVDVVVKDKDLSKEAQALFDGHVKAKILRFNYYTSEQEIVKDEYTVSRYRLKVKLLNKAYFAPKEVFDTVYIDYATKDTAGYCERLGHTSCEFRDTKYPLEFADYKIRTPFQWADIVESADVTTRSKSMDGKNLKELTFTAGGKEGIMWVDAFFGIPHEIIYDGMEIRFENLYINDQKDDDLHHPIMDEI